MITVIIPTYQRPIFLQDALQSLADQTFQDFDVVVVNDGGPPLRTMLEPWHDVLPLTLIELPVTRGPARARNCGIAQAMGDHIAFLDDDDIFLPLHLEMANRALSDTGADFIYLGAVVSGERMDGLPDDLSGLHLKAYEFDLDFLLVANYIHTGSVVIRNSTDPTMRFDESLSVCEDWDMWITLSCRLGYRIAFVDELTTVYHQVPASTGMVAQAQQETPSPFSTVRQCIYRKWPALGEQITDYRCWLTDFERYRNHRIATGRTIPTHLFDRVLHYLYIRFQKQEPIDFSFNGIEDLFDDVWAAQPQRRCGSSTTIRTGSPIPRRRSEAH